MKETPIHTSRMRTAVLFVILMYLVFILVNLNLENRKVEIPIPEISITILEPIEVMKAPFLEVRLDRISAYNPVPRQTDGDPNISSCGPNQEKQIAVSRDLFFDDSGSKHICGARATVVTDRGEVFEDYVVWDTMNPRYSNTADVFIPSTDESLAYAFGITQGTLIIHVD